MYLKYCSLLLILNNFVNGFGFFNIRNTFNYLNLELSSQITSISEDIKTRWIEQKFDHFDTNEKRKWKMRYFEGLSLWKSGGPVYLFLGGESEASSSWLSTGVMYDLAKETNGAMYVSEHRFYGDSKPLNGTDANSFKYLSSRQALADNAHLLKTIKSLPNFNNSKVVVIGGSYSGNLAAWMRLMYPDLVDAAIASSGPVLAKTDFYEYLEKVNDNYEQYGGPGCLDNIKNIFSRYEKLLQSSAGIEQLKKEENICNECDMTVSENQQVFFSYKVGHFMEYSQYGTTNKIENHCKSLNLSSELRRSQNGSKSFFWSERAECNNYDFNAMIKEYNSEENDWILAWIYQTCTEFGYFQTTSSKSQPFTDNIRVDFYTKMCTALFGSEFDKKRVDAGVEKTNEMYGGLKPNVTNVVFSNGDIDPWSTLGVLEDLSYKAPAVVIPRASHCRDLFSNGKGDYEELKEARKHIKYLIKSWIGAEDYLSM
ncbi:putative serine protease K12H4.7 [Vanessa cardui]|uniref:putative serine protease K12H4.7 n=1 Tax=Vanessa cardui TaxID=171605 RepID=UPI001F12CCED|nr:putative serine protease K12H4.7 [Vanessa cardui]